ncbi:hypothetical protein AB0M47_18665 [Hamadaea sp. NPDC051192]|uniref:hypothetical protein n=1 Tax=Hamadaea sp. NPDC051192 TaxID=3154940 RepID=UPI003447240A
MGQQADIPFDTRRRRDEATVLFTISATSGAVACLSWALFAGPHIAGRAAALAVVLFLFGAAAFGCMTSRERPAVRRQDLDRIEDQLRAVEQAVRELPDDRLQGSRSPEPSVPDDLNAFLQGWHSARPDDDR